MRIHSRSLLLVAVLGLGSPGLAAAQSGHAQHESAAQAQTAPATASQAGPAKMGGGMMGSRMMDMDAMHCMGLSDQRLMALKGELNITPAQLSLWNAFAAAAKSSPQTMGHGMGQGMPMSARAGAGQGMQSGHGMMASGPLPERLKQHEQMMTTHLETLRKMRAALAPLYEAFTPDQKAKADRLLCGKMG